ncbi:hypothetical protein ASF81_12785 [Brevundimonas sp. Leaf168]|nr:hypothetical protein ASF81_12785 [Brevundimonas sp. Leaf168]
MGSTHSVIKLLKERFSRSGGTLSFDVLIRDLSILLQDESLLRIVRSFWIQSPPESQTRDQTWMSMIDRISIRLQSLRHLMTCPTLRSCRAEAQAASVAATT